MKRYQKALPALLAILALMAGAWSIAPRSAALAQTAETPAASSRGLTFPPGLSANQKALLQAQYDFNPDISSITTGSLTGSDRTALDVMWAQNYAALQMTRLALSRARNGQVRAEARLMYQMLSKDQELLNQLEKQVGPAAGTPTPAATLAPTTPATTVPTEVATLVPTTPATVAPTEAATTAPTVTATTVPTTVPTEAATTVPTTAATAEGTLSAESRNRGPAPLSLSHVPILPDTVLGRLGFSWINLNGVFLNKVNRLSSSQFDFGFVTQVSMAENMAIDTHRVVQLSTSNPVLQALARHFSDEYGLNLVMLQILSDKVFFGQSLSIDFPAPGMPTPVGTSTPAAGDQSGDPQIH